MLSEDVRIMLSLLLDIAEEAPRGDRISRLKGGALAGAAPCNKYMQDILLVAQLSPLHRCLRAWPAIRRQKGQAGVDFD